VQERETLLKLKADEVKARGEPFDGEFYLWDYRYYDRLYLEKSLSLDDALVKEYFPVSVVVPTILEIYQNLLGVRFHEVKDAQTWHPDAQMFSVWAADAKDESDFVGYCYLDLFPRRALPCAYPLWPAVSLIMRMSSASKYSHAAVWGLLPGYIRPDGKRAYPLAAMVANLAKSTPDRPALMRHDDVVTFFHEMGHVFHGLLSHTQFSRFHGTNVARDFVEAPSQMLENWCWEPKVLKQMSKHYKTKEALSDELIEKLIQRCARAVVYLASFWTNSRYLSAAMSTSVSSICGSFSSLGSTTRYIQVKVS
jgi:Zn-dependent oligopeptidase